MDYQSVITNLREKIFRELIPIVNGNYYHLDNPYHINIGDNLIWEGEKQFLKHVPYKNLGNSSSASWRWPEIKNGDVILLHGGGNFGDLYRGAQDFRLEVIKRYSDNRIVMFPQSVWYDDMSLVEKDAEIMYRHKDLTLCLRDLPSYEFMKAHFPKCRLLLMPDMAFCILDSFLQRFRGKENGKELKVIGNLQEMWKVKMGNDTTGYPQAGIFVKKDSDKNIDALLSGIQTFDEDASEETIVEAVEAAGAENLGLPNAQIAAKTWDAQNIRYVTGPNAKEQVEQFLQLFAIEMPETLITQ